MGLDFKSAEFLCTEVRRGISLGCLLLLGRQTVYMAPREIAKVKAWTGVALKPAGFADEFFRALGAESISFLDHSNYEGADLVHDLNEPLAREYHARFETVIDGGTLEHVFNFPIALRSCMESVCEGGRLMIFSIANGHMGHGFYQFSPELFYRALAPSNGFEIERLLIRHAGVWYEASDPAAVGSRIEAVTSRPASIFVSARRVHLTKIFETWPIQSDYSLPTLPRGGAGCASPSWAERLAVRSATLAELQARWRTYRGSWHRHLSNRAFFRKLGASLL
ncbi:MAG: hypothetical protein JOY92_12845 [Verrucomicrobia bacterium]|nr:hypothetical protein [Verrucomicrobiota bacterium]